MQVRIISVVKDIRQDAMKPKLYNTAGDIWKSWNIEKQQFDVNNSEEKEWNQNIYYVDHDDVTDRKRVIEELDKAYEHFKNQSDVLTGRTNEMKHLQAVKDTVENGDACPIMED